MGLASVRLMGRKVDATPARQLEQPRHSFRVCMLIQKLLPSSCASLNAWVAEDRNHMQLVISSVKGLSRDLWVWSTPISVLMSPSSQDPLAFLFSALMAPTPFMQSIGDHRMCWLPRDAQLEQRKLPLPL